MKCVKFLMLSVLVSVTMIDAKAKNNNDESDVMNKSHQNEKQINNVPVSVNNTPKFDINKEIEQAKKLVDIKDKITETIESCYDLIAQLEQVERKRRHDNNKGSKSFSDQQIEDGIQSFLEQKLNFMLQDVLSMNKKMVTDAVAFSRQPFKGLVLANN